MTPPEPDADAPERPEPDLSMAPEAPSGPAMARRDPGNAPRLDHDQNTHTHDQKPQTLAMSDTDPSRPAFQDEPEHTSPLTSPPLPVDRQASRLKRPTHPGRPIHAPGASGLIEATEVPIPKPPSRPSSRPAQRPTSLLGSAPTSRPLPRPTDPLAPATAPTAPSHAGATPSPAARLPPHAHEASPDSRPEPRPEPAPRTPASRPATLRPATPRRDTPTALSGPLSAPPGTSPLSPTRPDVDLSASRGELAPVAPQTPLSPSTRPTLADPLPTLPDPLDLGLGAAERSATSPPGAPRVAIAAAFLIALLLPTSGRPPWALLDQPAGPTALALAGLLLLPGLTAGPPHLVRWALRLVVVVTLTALTALALADGYAHPPWGDALDPLHGSLSLLGLSLVLGAALAGSRASPPRLVAGTGLLLLVAAAFIPNDPGVPLLRLIGALTAADSSAADTGAALTTLAFAALALATGVLRLARPGRHLALALTTWLLAIAPLVVHAALSTPPSTWMDTLAPVKAALAFAAALLCCATALTPALEPETPQPAAGQAF